MGARTRPGATVARVAANAARCAQPAAEWTWKAQAGRHEARRDRPTFLAQTRYRAKPGVDSTRRSLVTHMASWPASVAVQAGPPAPIANAAVAYASAVARSGPMTVTES